MQVYVYRRNYAAPLLRSHVGDIFILVPVEIDNPYFRAAAALQYGIKSLFESGSADFPDERECSQVVSRNAVGVDFVKIAPHISKQVRRRGPVGVISGSVRVNLNRRINGKSLGEYRVLSPLQIFYYGERQEPLVFKMPIVIGSRKFVVGTQNGVYLGHVSVQNICARAA